VAASTNNKDTTRTALELSPPRRARLPRKQGKVVEARRSIVTRLLCVSKEMRHKAGSLAEQY
jgi:hypothetical protein